ILVISHVVHYFTVPFLSATTVLKQMDPEFEHVSASLGVPFYRTVWRVTLPLALPQIVALSMYFFLNAMVTLSAAVFLVAPGTELAPSPCCSWTTPATPRRPPPCRCSS